MSNHISNQEQAFLLSGCSFVGSIVIGLSTIVCGLIVGSTPAVFGGVVLLILGLIFRLMQMRSLAKMAIASDGRPSGQTDFSGGGGSYDYSGCGYSHSSGDSCHCHCDD